MQPLLTPLQCPPRSAHHESNVPPGFAVFPNRFEVRLRRRHEIYTLQSGYFLVRVEHTADQSESS